MSQLVAERTERRTSWRADGLVAVTAAAVASLVAVAIGAGVAGAVSFTGPLGALTTPPRNA